MINDRMRMGFMSVSPLVGEAGIPFRHVADREESTIVNRPPSPACSHSPILFYYLEKYLRIKNLSGWFAREGSDLIGGGQSRSHLIISFYTYILLQVSFLFP